MRISDEFRRVLFRSASPSPARRAGHWHTANSCRRPRKAAALGHAAIRRKCKRHLGHGRRDLPRAVRSTADRKSVVQGKSVSVRVELRGRRNIKQKKTTSTGRSNIQINNEKQIR